MPGHRFWLYVHCDLELGNMTLATNHDTPMVNICGKYYLHPILGEGVMVRTRHEHACSRRTGRQTDRQSGILLHELCGWYNLIINLIRLKWCTHLSRSLYLNFNYLVIVTAGGPVSSRGHM